MATSVDLPSGLENAVEAEMERGRYRSKSELIRDAIRRLLREEGMLEDRELSEEVVERVKDARETPEEDYRSMEEVQEETGG